MIDGKRCILICDDEQRMVRGVRDFLTPQGFHCLTAYDGGAAIDVYEQHSHQIDLILLDVMMPVSDGFDVLAYLRQDGSLIPVILFTARGEEYDQLKGFHLGADDYITKPFSPSLLMARIEAVLRRMGMDCREQISKSGITMNQQTRSASVNGRTLALKNREFDLLYFLMQSSGQAFSRDQILSGVWGYGYDGDIRTVDTHIKQIRSKLAERADCIKTVHRIGYQFYETTT